MHIDLTSFYFNKGKKYKNVSLKWVKKIYLAKFKIELKLQSGSALF